MKNKKVHGVPVCKKQPEGRALRTSGQERFLGQTTPSEWGRAEARPYKKQSGGPGSDVVSQQSSRDEGLGGIDAQQIWKQLEDVMVPRLRLTVREHAVYSYLVRHSRLEGELRARFSISGLARHIGLSTGPARDAVRRLGEHQALRLVERSKTGYVAEVRLPEEICAGCHEDTGAREEAHAAQAAKNIEEMDFLQNKALRQAIHAREGGNCFYCLRRLNPAMMCLDHVVPRAENGRNGYRNLVSSCLECNSNKGERAARDFLRELYREGRLTGAELAGRLRAVDALAAGKLQPVFAAA